MYLIYWNQKLQEDATEIYKTPNSKEKFKSVDISRPSLLTTLNHIGIENPSGMELQWEKPKARGRGGQIDLCTQAVQPTAFHPQILVSCRSPMNSLGNPPWKD